MLSATYNREVVEGIRGMSDMLLSDMLLSDMHCDCKKGNTPVYPPPKPGAAFNVMILYLQLIFILF